MSQSHPHDEHLGMCRICLVEPESSNYLPFVYIMTPINGEFIWKQRMLDLLGIDVDADDLKPKMICKYCTISLETWDNMKKKAAESEIVINYIASKKFGVTKPERSMASTSSLMLRNNEESSQESPFSRSRLPEKQSYKFGSSMPGTSKASTSAMMFRDDEESSQESPFSRSRLPAKQSYKFGSSMPGTSKASTSAMMFRDDEESSQESPFSRSRLTSKKSYKFGSSMPSTSKASTSAMMFRDDEESSQESPFSRSRLPAKQSYKFGSSMPGTSKASTSAMMFRDDDDSSQEQPRFNHSRLPSKRSNKFDSSMPSTSKASTSAMMFRDDDESSQEQPRFNHSRLSSKRSYKFDSSMPSTSKASTSAMMFRDDDDSSQEQPRFNHSRLPSKRSNNFGFSMPSTSKASTSSIILSDSEESSQEQPQFNHSRLLSKRSFKFDPSMPSTSKASTSAMMFRDDEESSREPPFNHSQSISKRSNKNGTILNGCNSNVFIASHLNSALNDTSHLNSTLNDTSHLNSTLNDESDDDSCILVTTEIETIELTTDDEDSEYDNDNFENERTNVHESYYEETVEISHNKDIVEISSDSEENDNNVKNVYFNSGTDKLYYCSICRKKNNLNHDCSQHTKSFFTCLVPCCNILSRSKKDFLFHYQPHIGMSPSEIMCHLCFKSIDQSNIDGNGCHIHCDTANAFKCYTCNIRFKNMQEFAFHKLKIHSGILMDALCNYLCLYCEESSPDILEITEHIKHCIENQSKNVTVSNMKLKKPTKNKTKLLPVRINTKKEVKKVMVRTNRSNKKIPCTSQHVLFTCLKPSCNKIFLSFTNFKYHYRRHFELGNVLVCWQCCNTFSGIPDLRTHQARNNCRIPGMYNCSKCPSKFDDLESMSIHKLTFHGGKLIASKKNRKTIMCAFCEMNINIFEFKSHLDACQKKDNKTNTRTKKNKGTYTCLACKRVFGSSISLSNHTRALNSCGINSNVKKE